MNPKKKLLVVKLIHTVIWIFFASVIFYILYAGLANEINIYTWIAIALVILEGLVLLIFRMSCPLTIVARKYSNSPKDNFDIFLPEWLARQNKLIFTSIYLFGLILVIIRASS